MALQTFDIKRVEIFSAGEWNGDEYTTDDLDCMATNFMELRSGIQPYLKLGHDENQELIQSDGLPALGWVSNLYRLGDKLYADFSQIPKSIYELIVAGAYKKVSSEIFWNLKIGEKVYNKVLAAVALLGADTPAVMNLKDILGMYKKEAKELKIYNAINLEIKSSNEKEFIMGKTEAEIKLEVELKAKNEEIAAEKAKYTASIDSEAKLKTEIEQLKQYKVDAEAREAKLKEDEAKAQVEAEKAKLEKFVTELISQKLCSKAMEPMVRELVGPEKKEYSLKLNEKETKLDKAQLLKETLKLFKVLADVNFDESSQSEKSTMEDDSAAIDAEAKKLMQEKKYSYGKAVKEILAKRKKQ